MRTTFAVWLWSQLGACSYPRTQIMLSITADDSIAQQTHHYRVRVYRWEAGKSDLRSETRFTRGDFPNWPARTGIVAHRDRLDEEYLAEVIAYGDDREAVPRSLARVISRFVRGRVIFVPVHLYPNCLCAEDSSTCDVSGTCTSARQDPALLLDFVPNATSLMDAAVDGNPIRDSATLDHDSRQDAQRVDASSFDAATFDARMPDAANAADARGDAPSADTSVVPMDDPFAPNACSGTPMTTAAALARLNGQARQQIAAAPIYVRARGCVDPNTCEAWRAPRPLVVDFLTWSGGAGTSYASLPIDTQLILYGGAPTWSIRHVTHVRRYPTSDAEGITFAMPTLATVPYVRIRAWNEDPENEFHYRDLSRQVGLDGELTVYEHCAHLRFYALRDGDLARTQEFAAVYRF